MLETVISTIILIQFKASEFLKTLLLNTENTKREGKKKKRRKYVEKVRQKKKKTQRERYKDKHYFPSVVVPVVFIAAGTL